MSGPAVRFRKSSRCRNSGCVEVAKLGDGTVAVRDSKNLQLQPRIFDQVEWVAFLEGVKAGEFDLDALDR